MQIDLNDPTALTLESVRALIASKDDSRNRQLRVTRGGIAYLSDEVGNQNTDNLAFRLETLMAGNGYVGQGAAQDDEWVERIYRVLKNNWPNPQSSYIDYF